MTSLHWQTSLQNRQCHALCTLGKTSKCWLGLWPICLRSLHVNTMLPHAMCTNFTCVIYSMSQCIQAYYLFGKWKKLHCGRGVYFWSNYFWLHISIFKKKRHFWNVRKMCSTKYDFNIPDLQCLYASLCNNTVVMWPLFIEIIVSFCVKITQGKFM